MTMMGGYQSFRVVKDRPFPSIVPINLLRPKVLLGDFQALPGNSLS